MNEVMDRFRGLHFNWLWRRFEGIKMEKRAKTSFCSLFCFCCLKNKKNEFKILIKFFINTLTMFNYPTIKDLFIKYDIDYSKIKKYKPLIKIKDKYINDYSIECHGDDCNILVISSKTKFYCLNADNYFTCDKCNYCYCYKCYNVCNNRKYYCEECDNHYSVAFIENYDINQLSFYLCFLDSSFHFI